MRFSYLVQTLRDDLLAERRHVQRLTRWVLPLQVLPAGFALAYWTSGWVSLAASALMAMTLLVQAELFIAPGIAKLRTIASDVSVYLHLPAPSGEPSLASALWLLAPTIGALLLSMALFMPRLLAGALGWQRGLALLLALGMLAAIWQRLAQTMLLLERTDARLAAFLDARAPHAVELHAVEPPAPPPGEHPRRTGFSRGMRRLSSDGLLDPALARRVAGLPLPALRRSPAATALLRCEAYLLLRDNPTLSDRLLIPAIAELGRLQHEAEVRHSALPPVGGKIYFPVAAAGTTAELLGRTMRRLGMDGVYSGSLHTWLVRLPPARSYAVAGRLIDAIGALGLLPPESIVPHHLTVQGDLGADARVLSMLHLAATPFTFEERDGTARRDGRTFIMRGGGVLDDLQRARRGSGQRTDFVDGFVVFDGAGAGLAEARVAHTVNLRIKQVGAYGLLNANTPSYARGGHADRVAAAFLGLRADLAALLREYDLAGALELDWIDGEYAALRPYLERLNRVKTERPEFLDRAQELRDTRLAALEALGS